MDKISFGDWQDFFKNYLFILCERVIERVRESQDRETLHLLVHSPNSLSGPELGWFGMKLGAKTLFQTSDIVARVHGSGPSSTVLPDYQH